MCCVTLPVSLFRVFLVLGQSGAETRICRDERMPASVADIIITTYIFMERHRLMQCCREGWDMDGRVKLPLPSL